MVIFFDTETTGKAGNFSAAHTDTANWPRIVQLAWSVHSDDGALVRGFIFNITPDGWIVEAGAEAIHGLSLETLIETGHPAPEVIAKFFHDYDQCHTLVAHNINFDFNVLACEAYRYKLKAATRIQNKICTMLGSTEVVKIPSKFKGKDKYKWPKLEELHRFLFNEDFDGAHNAMADVTATARCFFELRKRGLI